MKFSKSMVAFAIVVWIASTGQSQDYCHVDSDRDCSAWATMCPATTCTNFGVNCGLEMQADDLTVPYTDQGDFGSQGRSWGGSQVPCGTTYNCICVQDPFVPLGSCTIQPVNIGWWGVTPNWEDQDPCDETGYGGEDCPPPDCPPPCDEN
jgi:hypothetical protein